MFSDVTTVPDAGMLPRITRFGKRRHVLNAIADSNDAATCTPAVRLGGFVAGTLGRLNEDKGILDYLAVAADFPDPDAVFAVAGAGILTPTCTGRRRQRALRRIYRAV